MPVGTPSEVVLDFSGVKPFEPLDPGRVYKTRVTKFTLGESKEKKPKASLVLTIIAPEESQVEEWEFSEEGKAVKAIGLKTGPKGKPVMTKASGRQLFREYSLQDNALPYLYEFVKACNPDAKLGANFRLNVNEYLGLEVAARIQNEGYEEQVRARVQRVYPASKYTE